MAPQKHNTQILALARRGAEARLREIAHEFRVLLELFPDLNDAFDEDELPVSFLVARGSGQLTRNPSAEPRRQTSAAARRAASRRMKKYWAERKAAKDK